MSTLTIYFCGTGSNKYDNTNENYWNGELISTLAANTRNQEFAEWIIVDGPGSGNLQDDELFTSPRGAYDWSGQAFGQGWEENVKHAIAMTKGKFDWQREKLTASNYQRLKDAGVPIEEVKKAGSWYWRTYDYGDRLVTPQQLQEQIIKIFRKGGVIPTLVNLVGWSRGAISCHMMANAMLKDNALKDIPVNIFAVDPVPGTSNFQEHRIKIGDNVREYVAFYARDERSFGFTCVIPTASNDTRMHIYPMAGRHATLVGNASADGNKGPKELPEPGQLVRHFAETCLTRWGVDLDKKLDLSEDDISSLLNTIDDGYADYVEMRNTVYTFAENDNGDRRVSFGSQGTRYSAISGPQYTPNSGLSVNEVLSPNTYPDIR